MHFAVSRFKFAKILFSATWNSFYFSQTLRIQIREQIREVDWTIIHFWTKVLSWGAKE